MDQSRGGEIRSANMMITPEASTIYCIHPPLSSAVTGPLCRGSRALVLLSAVPELTPMTAAISAVWLFYRGLTP